MEVYPINLKLSRNLDNTINTGLYSHRKSFSNSTITKFSSIDTNRNIRRTARKFKTRSNYDLSLRKSAFVVTPTLPKEFNFINNNYEYQKIIPLSKKINRIPIKNIKKKNNIKNRNKNCIFYTDRKRLKIDSESLNIKFKSFNSLKEITSQKYYKKVYYDSEMKKSKIKNLNIRTYFDNPKKTKYKNIEDINSKLKTLKSISNPKIKRKIKEKKKNNILNNNINNKTLTPRTIHSENFFIRLLESNISNDIIKTFIRLKSIRWLWTHKKFILEKLIISFKTYKWFFEKNKYIDQETFEEYLNITSIGPDEEFSKQLFLIFQKSLSEPKINFIETICFFIITSTININHKINFILNAVENEISKEINFNYLISLFKKIFHSKPYLKVFDNFFHSIYNKYNNDETILYLNRNIIENELLSFSFTEKIFNHFLKNYFEIDKKLDDELYYAINSNLQKSNMILMSNMKIYDYGIVNKLEKIFEKIQDYHLGIDEVKKMKKELNLQDKNEIKQLN